MKRREFLLGSCSGLAMASSSKAFWHGSAGGSAPTNLTLPTVSPTSPVVGTVESGTNGGWSGSPTGYTYQWNWADVTTPISGATSATYTPVSGDVGHTLSLTVTASNSHGSASATSAATSAVTAASTGWSELPMGGGGFMRSIDVNVNDGTMIGRTDVALPVIWNGSKWITAVPNGSLPISYFNGLSSWMPGFGAYEIVSAPSNSSIVYMALANNLYKSTDKCNTWTATSLSVATQSGFSYAFPANTVYDCICPRMAVDPQNANIVFIGTMLTGVYKSLDGGTTWAQISSGSIPFATSALGHTIWFDTSSAVVGGATQGIYISSNGNGLYHSTDGGSTWSLVASSPTTIGQSQMVGGNYYCQTGVVSGLDILGTAIQLWNGSAWSTIKSGSGIATFAVDPNNTNRAIWLNGSGEQAQITFNGGSTWVSSTSETISSTIPWKVYPGVGDQFITVGRAVFNGANQVIISHGTGASTLPIPTSTGWPSGVIAYTDISMGIQSLVGNKVIWMPSNNGIIVRSDDFPLLKSDTVNFPSAYYPAGTAAYNNGFGVTVEDVDYAKDNSGTVISQLGSQSLVSTNWGASWSAMSNIPGTGTGCVAASTSTNWLFGVYGSSGGLWGTNNAGSSWTAITIPDQAHFTSFTLVADYVTANTYYLLTSTNGGGSTSNIYQVVWTGSTWTITNVFTGGRIGGSGTNVFEPPGYMRAVQGNAGHLFWGFGQNGGEATQNVQSSYIFAFSSNGGSTWTAITAICQPLAFAFGAPAAGQTYPAIYVLGYLVSNSAFGLYRCTTFNPASPAGASFSLCGTGSNSTFAPGGNIVQPGWLDADPTNYGHVVLSTQGQGYVQGYFP